MTLRAYWVKYVFSIIFVMVLYLWWSFFFSWQFNKWCKFPLSKGIKFCSSKPFTWNIGNAIHYGAFLTCLLIPKVCMTCSNKVCVISSLSWLFTRDHYVSCGNLTTRSANLLYQKSKFMFLVTFHMQYWICNLLWNFLNLPMF